MYEKPQYITPNGLERLDSPSAIFSHQKSASTGYRKKRLPQNHPSRQLQAKKAKSYSGMRLSDEAAKAIALALKAMIHS